MQRRRAFLEPVTPSYPTTEPLEQSNNIDIVSDVPNQSATPQLLASIATLQSANYVAGFQTQYVTGSLLLTGLQQIFAHYQIPIGLISKLVSLQGAALHFKIDDSSSMKEPSNLHYDHACDYTKDQIRRRRMLSRWEEAQDRMHTVIELLAYIPTGPITLSFFDRSSAGKRITLKRSGKTPAEFLNEAHQAIAALFSCEPHGNTPIFINMSNMFYEALNSNRTLHYLLTDGEPSRGECEIAEIKTLLQTRNAAKNPFTFLGCSNDPKDYEWMHEMEEVAKYVASIPDFIDAFKEVQNNHGRKFPYNRGIWILCNLAAASNPQDLEALNKHTPLSKPTLDQFMGRVITDTEYNCYFYTHPLAHRQLFHPDYKLFKTCLDASEISSVKVFQAVLEQELSEDIENDHNDTEAQVLECAIQAVFHFRSNPRTPLDYYCGPDCQFHVRNMQRGLGHHGGGFYERDRSCVCNIV